MKKQLETIKLKDTIYSILAISAWSIIFIDSSMKEGAIICFAFNSSTSNIINKASDLLAIASIITSCILIIRQEFKQIIFTMIYTFLLLNFMRHIKSYHYLWILDYKTIIPTISFLLISIMSIMNMRRDKINRI